MTKLTDEAVKALLDGAKLTRFAGYLVDQDGGFWSTHPWRGRYVRLLTPFPNSHGYLTVKVKVGNSMKKAMVHKEVCIAFHGPEPFQGAQVRHLDGSRDNNSARNLAWGTPSENAQDRSAHGRCFAHKAARISADRRARPVRATFQNGNVQSFPSISDAVKAGHSRAGIYGCLAGEYRQSGGAIWHYQEGQS